MIYNISRLTLFIYLLDKEDTTRPYLVIVISTNKILNIQNIASDADPGSKYNYYSIVSKLILYLIQSIDKYKEFFISIPIQLPSKTRPRLY